MVMGWKRLLLFFLVLLLLTSMFIFPMTAMAYGAEGVERLFQEREDGNEQDCSKMTNLPEKTKKKLREIYWRIYQDYANMIDTYYKAGAFTWKQRDTRLKMLKNYIQTFYRRNYRWCSEHEPDEWEEEWYNIDND